MNKTVSQKPYMIPLSPRAARGLCLLVYSALPLGYLADAILPDLEGAALVITGAVKLIGLIGSFVLFMSSYGQKSQQKDSLLDERERDERNRAYVATHRIMLALLFGFFLYSVAAKPLGWWLPDGESGFDMLSAFAIGSMSLPAAILAWRDRAPYEV